MPDSLTMTCIACGLEQEHQLFDLVLPLEDEAFADRRIARCPSCDLASARPMPTDEELARFYTNLQHGVRSDRPLLRLPLRLWRAKRDADLLSLLQSVADLESLILDVGSGSGRLVRTARNAGYQRLVASDYSTVNVELLAADGFDARNGSIDDIGIEPGSLDVVWASHVIEHMRDPLAFLASVRRLLAPEGRLVVLLPSSTSLRARTKTSTWHHVNPPGHLWGFNPANWRRLLEREGFAVERLANSRLVCELVAVAHPVCSGDDVVDR